MAVPEYVIEQIRNSNDIVSVISEHINLKKTGANYKAICPFHKEKTPSFVVSPEKQIYHCFGCNEGGNVFGFLMKYENISFFESLKKLAGRAGIALPEDAVSVSQGRSREEKQLLYEINESVAGFYRTCLKNSPAAKKAREYIRKRKISQEMIDRFGVGYAPATFGEVLRIGREKKYSRDLLEKAGLITYSEKTGKWLDKFFDRIMFPITDYDGRVIAFGGRTLGDKPPKYLNSPETPLFKKSKVLYGLDHARKPIRENERMIIVEGYMDVITSHQYGFDNTVATLGTALTEDHSRIIPRYTERVSMVYDSDPAGMNATLRGMGVLLDTNLEVTIAVFPEGSDPDSFLHSKGSDEYLHEIKNGLELVDFRIKTATGGVDINTANGKVSVAVKVLPFLGRIKNEIQQEEGIKKLSDAINVSVNVLKEELRKSTKGRSALKSSFEKVKRQSESGLKLEKNLILVLLKYPELAPVAFDEKKLSPDDFQDEISIIIISVIAQLHGQGRSLEPKSIISQVCKKYENDEELVDKVNKTVSSLSLNEIKYRNPDKTLTKLIKDFSALKNKKKYDELMKLVVLSLSKGKEDGLKEFVRQSRMIKGSNN